MSDLYAQPVYRARGGEICDTKEGARKKSREHCILKHVAKVLMIHEVQRCYWGDEGSDVYLGYEEKESKRKHLGWFLENIDAIIAAYKEACECADALGLETDDGA